MSAFSKVPSSQRGRDRPRTHATTSGILLAVAATPLGLVHGANRAFVKVPTWLEGSAQLAALSLVLAGLLVIWRPRLGRFLGTFGIAGTAALAWPHLKDSPLAALGTLLATTSTLVLLWKLGAPLIEISQVRRRPVRDGQAQGAAITALVLWFLWTFTARQQSAIDSLAVGWAMAFSSLFAVEWAFVRRSVHPFRTRVLAVTTLACASLCVILWGSWWWMVSVWTSLAALSSVLIPRPPSSGIEPSSFWEPLMGNPQRLLIGTFAALCVGGCFLLALPQSATGAPLSFVDALFTATSAVCVTGLIVVDTPTALSGFGQAVVFLLIQIGGLGIMTFSTVAIWLLGRRMSLRHEGAVASLISAQDRGKLFTTAARILLFTVTSEGLGALILTLAFLAHGDSFAMALWRGVFTSVSAFCNAGFALQTDNMIPYQTSPLILHTVSALVIVGGLSPLVVFSIPNMAFFRSRPVLAQARLALITTMVLLVLGFVGILAFEWNDSLAGLSGIHKLHNAWFQSVSLRTAGFNSVDITVVRPATLSLMLLWMFIGGSPGSTAGGIKTTTLAVLVLSVVQAMRGQWTLEAFGKRIPEQTRAKATVIVSAAFLSGFAGLLALQLTQHISSDLVIFEVVSALGTVGLTIGATAQLDGIGKGIVAMCMFVGRVGAVTLLMFLSSRRSPLTLGRPEEEVDVG